MNNLDPLALFQQFKSGVPLSSLLTQGQQSYQRPAQILPQALPTVDYSALYRAAHPAPMTPSMNGNYMGGEGVSGEDGSAAAAASAANGDAVGGIGGGGGAGGK